MPNNNPIFNIHQTIITVENLPIPFNNQQSTAALTSEQQNRSLAARVAQLFGLTAVSLGAFSISAVALVAIIDKKGPFACIGDDQSCSHQQTINSLTGAFAGFSGLVTAAFIACLSKKLLTDIRSIQSRYQFSLEFSTFENPIANQASPTLVVLNPEGDVAIAVASRASEGQ